MVRKPAKKREASSHWDSSVKMPIKQRKETRKVEAAMLSTFSKNGWVGSAAASVPQRTKVAVRPNAKAMREVKTEDWYAGVQAAVPFGPANGTPCAGPEASVK